MQRSDATMYERTFDLRVRRSQVAGRRRSSALRPWAGDRDNSANKGFHNGDATTKNVCQRQKFVIGLD